MNKMKRGLALVILSLLFVAPFILGAGTSDVKITTQYITSYSALVNVNFTSPEPINNAIIYYKFPHETLKTADLYPDGVSLYYSDSENGVNMDYKIEVFLVSGGTIYYPGPSAEAWASYDSSTASSGNKEDSITNTSSPIQTSNQTQEQTKGITGNVVGVISNFVQTPAGIISIIFITLVLLIALIASSQRKLKILKAQEQIQKQFQQDIQQDNSDSKKTK